MARPTGLSALASALHDGMETAAGLVAHAIECADLPAAAGVFTLRLDGEARRAAVAADRARSSGGEAPFLGVPITIKDNIALRGYPTTAGSRVLAGTMVAAEDALVVTRLRQAGFIVLGRTNMTEFAFSGLGLNPHYGTPANPAFTDAVHIPGGSTSGGAVSVALGIVPATIGTDTGGSLRIPAAFCGLVGFKPTASAVSSEGVLPLSGTLDAVGVIASGVADCRMLFDVIRQDEPQPARADGGLPRIGVVSNYVMQGLDPAVHDAFEAGVARLAAAGARIERIEIPILDTIPEMMRDGTIPAAEAFAWHRQHLPGASEADYDPRVISRIKPGGTITSASYLALLARRREMIAAFAAAAQGFDALAWPTVPITAPAIDVFAEDDAYHRLNALVLRNSTVINLADGCAISLPLPTDGAPTGITLAAAHGRDDALLATALQVEAIFSSFHP